MLFNAHRTLTLATMVVAMTGATLLGGRSAEAGHYGYSGRCFNFHGEDHVIAALNHMDEAALATCNRDRILATVDARSQVLAAYREFCDDCARRELLNAVRELSRYVGSGEPCRLDAAQQHMLAALAAEQNVHRAVHVHPAHRPVHQPAVVVERPVVPTHGWHDRDQFRYGSSYRNGSNITLQGRRFSIGFSF